MRLAWATDIHLNFARADVRHRFLDSVAQEADAVVITGDIAESCDVVTYLRQMERALRRPIYFVLGNHDFYRGSIAATREAVARAAADSEYLVYLTAEDVVELTPQTALVGHDGWADAQYGDFENSEVILNDYVLISDLRWWRDRLTLDKPRLATALLMLGNEAGRHFRRTLSQAAGAYPHVIAATHVPPLREATWHLGRLSDDDWLPHFSCRAAGEAMLEVLSAHPQCRATVLCGHTHSSGECVPLENLRIWTGEAEYGEPRIERVMEVA